MHGTLQAPSRHNEITAVRPTKGLIKFTTKERTRSACVKGNVTFKQIWSALRGSSSTPRRINVRSSWGKQRHRDHEATLLAQHLGLLVRLEGNVHVEEGPSRLDDCQFLDSHSRPLATTDQDTPRERTDQVETTRGRAKGRASPKQSPHPWTLWCHESSS